jgi:hypothetical protein
MPPTSPCALTVPWLSASAWGPAVRLAHLVFGSSILLSMAAWSAALVRLLPLPRAFLFAGLFTGGCGAWLLRWTATFDSNASPEQLSDLVFHDLAQFQHFAMSFLLMSAGASEILHGVALCLSSDGAPFLMDGRARLTQRWTHSLWALCMASVGVLFIAHPQHTPDEVRRHVLLGVSIMVGAAALGVSKRLGKIDGEFTVSEAPAPLLAAVSFAAAASILLNFEPPAEEALEGDATRDANVSGIQSPPLRHTATRVDCHPATYAITIGGLGVGLTSAAVLFVAALADAWPSARRLCPPRAQQRSGRRAQGRGWQRASLVGAQMIAVADAARGGHKQQGATMDGADNGVVDMLTPSQCRWQSGPTVATGHFRDARGACLPTYRSLPDRHCIASAHKRTGRLGGGLRGGSQPAPRSVTELLRLLRGRRLAFIGDSLTGQASNALECAMRRSVATVGALEQVAFKREAPALASACAAMAKQLQLSGASGTASKRTDEAGRQMLTPLAFDDSMCRALGAGNFATQAIARNATYVTLAGVRVPTFNFTFTRRFGDVYFYDRRLHVRDQLLSSGVPPPPPRQLPLPTHVSLVDELDLADVIVFNFGLHYGDSAEYRQAMGDALRELEAFATAKPGRAAVIVETSAQHFPVPSGDYNDAIRKDPNLVLSSTPRATSERRPLMPRAGAFVEQSSAAHESGGRRDSGGGRRHAHSGSGAAASAQREWAGPSMCAQIASDAPPHWRNQVVHSLLATGRFPHVKLQPFEALTRPRWDFHAQTKFVGGSWKSDCTHWCWSECMWSEVLSDLHDAIAVALRAR